MEPIISEKKTSVGRNSLDYGIISGIALVIFSIIIYVSGISEVKVLQYLPFAILFFIVVLAILNYRNKINGGFISYGKSLVIGLLVGLIASFIVNIYNFIFFSYIDPGIIDKMLSKSEEAMRERNPNMTDEQINMGLGYAKMFMQPWIMSLLAFLSMSFFNFLGVLIISIFTMKSDNYAVSNLQ
jgi:hypothetical protein